MYAMSVVNQVGLPIRSFDQAFEKLAQCLHGGRALVWLAAHVPQTASRRERIQRGRARLGPRSNFVEGCVHS